MTTKLAQGSLGQCLKYLLFAANFIFLLMGCALMGVGIWIVLKKDFMSQILGTSLMSVSVYMLIAGGALTFIVYFVGCCGAIYENKQLLLSYALMIVCIVVVLLLGGVLAIVFHIQIGERIREYMRETLRNEYGVHLDNRRNRLVTEAWNETQRELHCCSVDDQGWALYRESEWHKQQTGIEGVTRPFVPLSCCRLDTRGEYRDTVKCQTFMEGPPGRVGTDNTNEGLNYRGCYPAGKDYVREFAGYLIGMGLGVGIIMIAGFVISLWLYRQL